MSTYLYDVLWLGKILISFIKYYNFREISTKQRGFINSWSRPFSAKNLLRLFCLFYLGPSQDNKYHKIYQFQFFFPKVVRRKPKHCVKICTLHYIYIHLRPSNINEDDLYDWIYCKIIVKTRIIKCIVRFSNNKNQNSHLNCHHTRS